MSRPLPKLLELAYGCRILHGEGHADMTLGHLSLRDPDGRGLWLKRSGIGLGEVNGPDDFLLIDFQGKRLSGDGRLHKEWPLHTEILKARPDVNAVGHTHPFHATAFSQSRQSSKR
jgi:L-fuculose-phosphate aldolase